MYIELYQIAYNEETIKKVDVDNAIEFQNRASDKYLENTIISRFSEFVTDRASYFGILSARFDEKMQWKQSEGRSIAGIRPAIEKDGYSHDVYSFFGSNTIRNVWVQADRWQPGVLEIAEIIFKQFAIERGQPIGDLKKLDTPIIYQNAFVAKREIYADYVNNWLIPLINIMETNEAVKPLLFANPNYKDAKLTEEECMRVFGVPHYTFHSFVCERFFSTYLALNEHITLKHI